MAAVKRKENPQTRETAQRTSKKVRTESRKKVRPLTPPSDLEAQTDSDPIVESDTTEHSGDDNGVSWPSDDDDDDGGVSAASTNDTKATNNGVELPNSSKSLGKVVAPGTGSSSTHNREQLQYSRSFRC